MLNVKKMHGRKGNKQGMILVMVLFIFAISLILICCALMLTTGTRGRVYRRAEDSQARLTVTAAAESFLQALYMGDIQDDDLIAIANQGVSNIVMQGGNIPGMSDGAADNQTVLSVRRAIEGDADSDVILEFTTTIDQQSENIQVVLHYTPPEPPPPPPSGHANMIETSGSADLHETIVGNNADGTPGPQTVDNLVLARGDLDFATGGTAHLGSIFATLGNAHIGDSIDGGTLVLYGESGIVTGQGSNTAINGTAFVDELMFINPNAANSNPTWTSGNTAQFHGVHEYYVGRDMATRPSGAVAASSYSTTASTLGSQIAARVAQCITNNPFTAFTVPDDAPQWNPTDAEVYRGTLGGSDYAALTELPDITSNGQTISNGTYFMTGNIDGSSSINYVKFGGGTIYVGGTCNIRGLKIWCTASTQIILLPGATLNITLEGVNKPSGFLSTPGRTVADADTTENPTWPSDAGSEIPRLEIIGYGGNHLELDDRCVLDAFLSLYNSSTMAMSDTGNRFYGRILIDNNGLGNTGAPKEIPYCPGDGGASPIDDSFHVQYSNFDIVSFWYYY